MLFVRMLFRPLEMLFRYNCVDVLQTLSRPRLGLVWPLSGGYAASFALKKGSRETAGDVGLSVFRGRFNEALPLVGKQDLTCVTIYILTLVPGLRS